jgi:putative transposase
VHRREIGRVLEALRIFFFLHRRSWLRHVVNDRPDQVWAVDITDIQMKHGFINLVAIIDWFSRYVVAWSVSITMEVDFCVESLTNALESG